MRLLKLDTRKNTYQATVVREDESGKLIVETDPKTGEPLMAEVEVLEPEGLEQRSDVAISDPRGPVESEVQLYLVPDDEATDDDPRRARPADLPLLDAPGHPLHGLPVLPVVLSGMRDSGVDDRGRVLPYDLETGRLIDPGAVVEPEPTPVEGDLELSRA